MTLYKKTTALMLVAFSFFASGQATASGLLSAPENGKEYTTLTTPVTHAPKVIEFFSFYCGPCYQFVEKYPVSEAINKILPEGETVTKYHVNALGPLGNELTEAWAIAMVMGKTDAVEKKLFEALRNKKLTSVADIQAVFAQEGIDAETYEKARGSLTVKGAIARQNNAIAAFGVKATPSFYVDGKYHINNAAIAVPTPEAYASGYAEVVKTLLEK